MMSDELKLQFGRKRHDLCSIQVLSLLRALEGLEKPYEKLWVELSKRLR